MKTQNLRQVYGTTLVELGKEDERIVVLEADLGKSTMSYMFQEAFPERYFEMGIAEQNMTSFAAGLAASGKIAFTNSFAVFATGRAYDQIRQSICTAKLNVKIVGSSAGLSDFGDGATHQAVEDISIMRSIPNMTVLVPMDSIEVKKAMRAVVEHKGPCYLRISRSPLPDLYPQEADFKIGEPILIRDGADVTLFACGAMVSKAVLAAEIMSKKGVSVKVVNVSSLKPVNEDAIRNFTKGVKGIVTAEEHSLIGGLASVITNAMRGISIPIETIGIRDSFGQSAHKWEELMEFYGLTERHIVSAITQCIHNL